MCKIKNLVTSNSIKSVIEISDIDLIQYSGDSFPVVKASTISSSDFKNYNSLVVNIPRQETVNNLSGIYLYSINKGNYIEVIDAINSSNIPEQIISLLSTFIDTDLKYFKYSVFYLSKYRYYISPKIIEPTTSVGNIYNELFSSAIEAYVQLHNNYNMLSEINELKAQYTTLQANYTNLINVMEANGISIKLNR